MSILFIWSHPHVAIGHFSKMMKLSILSEQSHLDKQEIVKEADYGMHSWHMLELVHCMTSEMYHLSNH